MARVVCRPGAVSTSNEVTRMDKAGKTQLVSINAPADNEGTAASESTVYWAAFDANEIRSAAVSMAAFSTFASGLAGPRTLALDGTHLNWVNSNSGTLQRKSITGGSIETVAQNLAAPWGTAVDASAVYVSTQTGIYRCDKQPGSTPLQLFAASASGSWDSRRPPASTRGPGCCMHSRH
ncbi:MAG: hypothetical protein IPI67_38730 [Myxococcales bacterium]|nr:hypothetical protein [Myxococcales bacterium]